MKDGPTLDSVQPFVMELRPVRAMRMSRLAAVARSSGPPHFEKIAKVGAEEDVKSQTPWNTIVVLDDYALVADCLPNEFRPAQENAISRQPVRAKRHIGICQIHGQSRLILVHGRA